MKNSKRISTVILAHAGLMFAGAISWLLLVFLLRMLKNQDFVRLPLGILGPGFFLGFTLALYLAIFERFRGPARAFVFVVACTLSLPISLICCYCAIAMGLLHLDFNFGGGPTEIPDLFPFIAGYVGAFIVLAAGSLSYCLEQWDILTAGMIFISSFVGGFLGVLELKFIACSSHDIYLSFAPLAFIWPTGVALLLGLLLHWE